MDRFKTGQERQRKKDIRKEQKKLMKEQQKELYTVQKANENKEVENG